MTLKQIWQKVMEHLFPKVTGHMCNNLKEFQEAHKKHRKTPLPLSALLAIEKKVMGINAIETATSLETSTFKNPRTYKIANDPRVIVVWRTEEEEDE